MSLSVNSAPSIAGLALSRTSAPRATGAQPGYLFAGQEISPAYLQLLATKYAGDEYSQSFGFAIDNALSYLTGQAPQAALDVTA